jgi:serine/threonine-protein kinase
MLAGRAPFVDDDAVVVMARHIKDAPLPLSEVAAAANIPASLEAVVFKALAKSPDERPQSAEQMSAELESAVEATQAIASGVQPAQVVVPEHSGRSSSVRGIVIAAITGLVVLGAAVAATHLRPPPTPEVDSVTLRLPAPAVVSAPTSVGVAEPVNDAPALAEATPEQAESTENSSSTAASASATRGVPRLRVARPRSSAPSSVSLPRKGNERYGRFE